jgi:predicted alpha/beta hydrolase family esterase
MAMKLGQKLAIHYIRARLNMLAVVSPKKAAQKAFHLFCTPFYRSKRQAPPIFEKAIPVTIDVTGIAVRGFNWNRGGTKRILILHGYESSCKNFDAYVRGLLKKNYEVLAFDAPAHGQSGGKQITLPLYISMIETIYTRYGGIHGFIAHSFGGLALVHFIEQIPHSAATRLALVAPATETKTAIDSFFRFLQLGSNVRKEFEKIIYEKTGLAPGHFSIPRAMQHIRASVLWVHDKDDDITPLKDVEPLIGQHQPHVSFMITEGLGHKKIYRDSKVISSVVDFL